MDGGGDGHVDAVLGGEVDDGAGGGDAFDDGGLFFEVGVEFFAAAEGFAAGAVAAFGGEAGGGEVADAGDAEEGFGEAPMAAPRREISARPRARRADLAL